ncbi:aldose-1-epimerase [Ornithinimicrobium tianjinense]|uniref:Aldose 1-epimerase n=1 Tax=Ornithinimicrobium tianjinense TaxID=1195761 RepID=A0A917BDY4_9MICO|nr:aldose-1-epimerase [Ornithinimicrobium tianjinense]GGF39368.1 aldose 1-epimerase [Ornithinimicrobium tianjinense]
MSINGQVTRLRAGDYEATVAAVGASLLTLTHRGRHLVQPALADALNEGYQGRTLVPWANRVVGGHYEVGGTTYELPVNEPATGAALHGLGAFQAWVAEGVAPHRVTWVLDLPASYGYPFDVLCRADYVLDAADGLTVTVSGTNQGDRPAPFGPSTHPYLSCDDRPLDECTLRLPARAAMLTDARLSPTEVVPVAGTQLDFLAPTPVLDRMVDNAYTDLPEGTWEVELTHPEAVGVRMTSDARWVQLYTGDRIGRRGAAVEPMTCPPDAFNIDPGGVLLAPGDSRALTLTIDVLDR